MKPSASTIQPMPAALAALTTRVARAATLATALLLGLLVCAQAPVQARESATAAPAPAAGAASAQAGTKAPADTAGLPAAGNISVRDAATLLRKAPPSLIILDVRTPGEFREGHIPGARNMDFFGGGFEMQAASLPRDAVLLVYCRSGKRSAGAAEILDEAGIRHILHMNQGFEAWKEAGLPQER